jgi:hypothetical protein
MAEDNDQKPMPRSNLREDRQPLPDPDDDSPESDSLRVMHYKAMLRMVESLHKQPPMMPSPDAIKFEAALEDETHGTVLRAVVTYENDELITWFAIAGGDVDDSNTTYLPAEEADDDALVRTPFVPIDANEDLRVLYKTIFYDYATDHPNVCFFLPLGGPRIRPQDEYESDTLLLWYRFDVGGLKYVFQIDQGPDVESEDAAVVADHESVLNFLAQLGDGIKKVLQSS